MNEEGVVTEKGRVAANIQSADELVLTELMFSGGFKVLSPCLPDPSYLQECVVLALQPSKTASCCSS